MRPKARRTDSAVGRLAPAVAKLTWTRRERGWLVRDRPVWESAAASPDTVARVDRALRHKRSLALGAHVGFLSVMAFLWFLGAGDVVFTVVGLVVIPLYGPSVYMLPRISLTDGGTRVVLERWLLAPTTVDASRVRVAISQRVIGGGRAYWLDLRETDDPLGVTTITHVPHF